VRGAWISGSCISHKIYHEFFVKFFHHFVNSYSYVMSCAPCIKTKAACKPFDADKVHIQRQGQK